jgi:hypothetical protein
MTKDEGTSVRDIVAKPEISFNFELADVKQGGLGDCYFIAAVASLAYFPQMLK